MAVLDFGHINIIILYLSLVFGAANVCLLAGLLYSYWRTYKEVRSGFTIGLLYFASLILVQNIFITTFLALQLILPPLPPNINFSDFHEPTKPLFFVNFIQLIALSILFKITRE